MELFNKKSEKKKSNKFLLLSIILISIGVIIPFAEAQSDLSWTDPRDDITCISILDFLAVYGDLEDPPDTYEEIMQLLNQLENVGVQSATPDCIDIISVEIINEDPNSTIVITMEGAITDCDWVQIIAYGNCSGEGLNLFFGYTGPDMGGDGVPQFGFFDGETKNSSEGAIDGAEISWEFPTDLLDFTEDCALTIVAYTFTGDMSNPLSLTLCFDVFPNEEFSFNNPGSYSGLDPIVEFIDTLSSWIFGFMCGRLPFLLFMTILVAVANFLIDRKKSRAIKYTGMGVMLFNIYALISYSLFIDVINGSLFANLIGIVDLTSFICLMMFGAVSIFAGFRNPLMKDNDWLLILSSSLALGQSVIYLLPFFYYSCGGSPIISLIVQVITLTLCIVSVRISMSLKKRGV